MGDELEWKHHDDFTYEHVGMDCIFVQGREELEYMSAAVVLNTSRTVTSDTLDNSYKLAGCCSPMRTTQ